VAFENEGVQDCAEGAKVVLTKEGEKLGETITDEYGDFKFDRITPGSGRYSIKIEGQDQERKEIEVKVDGNESCSLGTIWM
jgi:protocatechuate 3,4-dioxygenase beta subunit